MEDDFSEHARKREIIIESAELAKLGSVMAKSSPVQSTDDLMIETDTFMFT